MEKKRYKSVFIQVPANDTSDEIYKKIVSFDEIYALYNFDQEQYWSYGLYRYLEKY